MIFQAMRRSLDAFNPRDFKCSTEVFAACEEACIAWTQASFLMATYS